MKICCYTVPAFVPSADRQCLWKVCIGLGLTETKKAVKTPPLLFVLLPEPYLNRTIYLLPINRDTMDKSSLFQQQHFMGLDKISPSYLIQVHTSTDRCTETIRTIPHCLMITTHQFTTNQFFYLSA